MKSVKEYRAHIKAHGVFYTGDKLARELRGVLLRYIPEEEITEVYDPTCGSGNLLSVWGDDVRKYGQELDEGSCEEARARLKNAVIYCGDTLGADAFDLGGGLFCADRGGTELVRFGAIVANPPFSIPWCPDMGDARFCVAPCAAPTSRADWAFHLHCLAHLENEGVAVVLCFPGALYRGQREKEIRRWFVDNGYIHEVIGYEGDYFDDTKIATCAIVIRRQRAASIKFSLHGRGLEAVVGIDAVRENDYSLTPQTYVHEEEERRVISAEDLQRGNDAIIRQGVAHAVNTAEFLRLTDEMEGTSNAERFMGELLRAVEDLRESISTRTE